MYAKYAYIMETMHQFSANHSNYLGVSEFSTI